SCYLCVYESVHTGWRRLWYDLVDDLRVVVQPGVGLGDDEIDESVVRPVEHDLAHQLCQHRGLPGGHEPWHDDVPGQRLDGIVVDAGENILQATCGPFDHDVPVAGFGQPLSRAMGDFDGSDLRRHRLGVEEVRGHEGREARAERVL